MAEQWKSTAEEAGMPISKYFRELIEEHTAINRPEISQKDPEKYIREIKDSYHRIIDNADEVIFRVMADGGHVVYANPAAERLLGYSKDEWLIDPSLALKIIHPDYAEKQKQIIEEINTKKNPIKNTVLGWISKDGREILVELTILPVLDKDGKILYFESIGRDITEKKKLREVFEKEKDDLKLIIDSSPIIIFYKDREGRFVRVNKAFAEALNTSEEDFLGKTVFDFYSKKIAQQMTNDDQEIIKSGRPKLNIIEQYESASGLRWVQTDKIPIYDKEGVLVGVLGFAQDITIRKNFEDKMANLSKFPSENPNPVFRFTKDGKVLYANEAAKLLLDIREIDIGGIIPKQFRAVIAKSFQSGTISTTEFTSNDRTFSFTITPITDGGYVNVYGVDITDTKKAEESLKQSEEKFRLLAESSHDLITIADENAKTIWANIAWKKIFGDSLEIEGPFTQIHPNDASKVSQAWKSMMENEKSVINLEYRYKNPKGGYLSLETNARKENIDNKTIFYITAHDITEKKQAEESLRESEERYHSLFDTMINGFAYFKIIFDKDNKPVDFVYLDLNEAFEKIMGFKKEDVVGKRGTEVIVDVKDSTPELLAQYGPALFSGEEADFEIYLDTLKKWIHIIAFSPVKDLFAVIFEDITNRKKSEEIIIRSKNHLQSIINNVPRLIITFDKDKKVTSWNKTAELISGYKEREIVGRSVTQLKVFNDRQELAENLETFINGKKTEYNELILKTKKGPKKIIQLPHSFIRKGEIGDHRVLVIGKDVTYDRTQHGRLLQGTSYYISDTDHESAKNLFLDLVASGHAGLYITRTNVGALQSIRALSDFQVALMQRQKMDEIPTISDLEDLLATIKKFSEKNENPVILLDRVDYLLTTFSFEHVIRFLYQINEIISEQNSLLLIHLNPSVLDSRNLARLTEEFHPLPGKKVDEIEILDELYYLLQFINEQNQNNLQVSLKKIRAEFSISYPTVERRCKALEAKGLVFTKKSGRSTTLYLSEKGKALLQKTSIL